MTARGKGKIQRLMEEVILSPYCQCGCGQLTEIAKRIDLRFGYITGQPKPWIKGHAQRGVLNQHWKGEAARTAAKRMRAKHMFPLGPCEQCGLPACDRHHKDGDTGHNTRDNILLLCRRCHMAIDGRAEQLGNIGREYMKAHITPPQNCLVCARLYKPLRRGLCERCANRRYKSVKKPRI